MRRMYAILKDTHSTTLHTVVTKNHVQTKSEDAFSDVSVP